MPTPPTGTVTFLFTDIEGSTSRWEHHRSAMAPALARHNALLEATFVAHDGYVFKTIGDAYCVAFADAAQALAAAVDAQRALSTEDWSRFGEDFPFLRVRMALHTGLAEYQDGDYRGPTLNRVARLLSAAHGGQVLLSLATQQLARDTLPEGATLHDLGVHRLKDLKHAEHLFRLSASGFPDLASPPDTAEQVPAGAREHLDVTALPTECPYRGLYAFREEDAAFFFGREAFTNLLEQAIGRQRLVGVIGPSGSGKSSVVQAGLLPRLRASTVPWTVVDLRPGTQPFHALAAALVPTLEHGLTETARLVEISRLAEALRDGTLTLLSVLDRIAELGGGERVLVFADQFEELYTLCRDVELRHRFLDCLFESLMDPVSPTDPRLTLVLTLRADFMGHALAYRPFADALQDHNVVLGPMIEDELRRAVIMPAEKQGRVFESGLAERILADVGEEPGNLPLLEFALTSLWENQQEGWLTHEAYEAIGRVEGALARHADTVYERLHAPDQAATERVFLQLVRPGEGTEDTRRVASHAELGDEDWTLVRKLADARLVVTDRDAAGVETAEVVHEALIRSWGRLKGWMEVNRAFRTWQERLRFALRQWQSTDHDEGALLRGAPLAEAEGWLKDRGADLSPAEREFIEAGLSERDRENAERESRIQRELAAARQLAASAVKLRRLAVLAVAGAVAAIGLAGLAFVLRQQAVRQARISTIHELVASAKANLTVDPERSILLALQAARLVQPGDDEVRPRVESILHRAVYEGHAVRSFVGHTDVLWSAVFSPDNTRIATASNDKTVRIWDVATGKTVQTLQHSEPVGAVDFSPDGRRVATGSDDNIARVWDLASGTVLISVTDHISDVWSVDFSPDGRRFATASDDQTAAVWDAKTGRRLSTLMGHTRTVTRVRFSPDGSHVATSSGDQTVRIWDSATGRALQTLTGHEYGLNGVDFSPDGLRLASSANNGTIIIWNLADGRPLRYFPRQNSEVPSVSFSPDGRWLATGGREVLIWDAETGEKALTLSGHTGSATSVVFSGDGKYLLTAGSDHEARLWDVGPSRELITLFNPSEDFEDVAFSPDGRLLAAASDDRTVWLANVDDGELVRQLTGHTKQMNSIAFSADGHRIVTGSFDQSIRIWQLPSGREVLTTTQDIEVWRLAANRDADRVVSTANSTANKRLLEWDVATNASRTLFESATSPNSVTFSPDGDRIATTDDGAVVILGARDGRLLKRFVAPHGGRYSVVLDFSPDGRHLALARQSLAALLDLENGTEDIRLVGHNSEIARARFSPDGRQIATASGDRTARLWDVATGRELLVLDAHRGTVASVAFSPDGKRLATASYDDTVSVWVLPFDELLTLARSRVTRTLTAEECATYLHVAVCPPES